MRTLPSCGEPVRAVEDTLTTLWAALPASLRRTEAPAASLLRALPDTILGYYFETHFDPVSDGSFRDLLLQVPLLGQGRPGDHPGPLSPFVERIRRWFAGSSAALGCPPLAWLELDGVADDWERHHPGLSICVDPHFHPHQIPQVGEGLPPGTLRELVDELDEVCGAPSGAAATVERIVRQWPRLGRVRHLSIMSGRAHQPRKVYGIVPRGDLAPFLHQIGWSGNFQLVIDLQAVLPETLANLHVDLTVMGSSLTPRLALEVFSDPPPYEDFSRKALVRGAVERGWLPANAPELLVSWLGEQRGRLDDGSASRVLRWFDLKFCTDGQRPFVKAYLGAQVGRAPD
jgi:hypothetical protein